MGIGMAASVLAIRARAVTQGGQGIVVLAHIIRDFIATATARMRPLRRQRLLKNIRPLRRLKDMRTLRRHADSREGLVCSRCGSRDFDAEGERNRRQRFAQTDYMRFSSEEPQPSLTGPAPLVEKSVTQSQEFAGILRILID
jgi:hypothetical protein